MRIAMIGTRGVPARYGGFETCVEEVGRRLVERGHDVRVYCRGGEAEGQYLGMSLVRRPAMQRKSLETLSHSALSVEHLLRKPTDVALVFNAANAPFLPFIRGKGIPVATHVDGLEWKRAKWGGAGRRYYRTAESLAVRWSDALIADAQGIADYYRSEFGAATELITYGAPITATLAADTLPSVGLASKQYHLVVARFEPENHVAEIVDGYVRSRATRPLVVVGSSPYGHEYAARIHELADGRVRMLGGVWDQRLLDELYAHAYTYLHGHSVGGTNPSLLRAIGAGTATIAYDVSFNREVLGASGSYFTDPASVARAVEAAEDDPADTTLRGELALQRAARYDWDEVALAYERLCARLVAGRQSGVRPDGHRLPAPLPESIPAPAPVTHGR